MNGDRSHKLRKRWTRSMRFLALMAAFLVFLSACATSPRQVHRAIARTEFGPARQMLEEMGAGEYPEPDLSERQLAARDEFELAVTSAFTRRAETFLQIGDLQSAVREIDEGLRFCPWSASLQATHQNIVDRIAHVGTIERQWFGQLADDQAPIEHAREFLSQIRPIGMDYAQSTQLTTQRRLALTRIESHWRDLFREFTIDTVDMTLVVLAEGDLSHDEFDSLRRSEVFITTLRLLATEPAVRFDSAVFEQVAVAIGTGYPRFAMGDLGESIAVQSMEILSEWFDQNLDLLFETEPTLRNVSAAERIGNLLGPNQTPHFRESLALFHLRAAERLSGMSTAAILSFVHLSRSNFLFEGIASEDVDRISAAAIRSLVDSNELHASIHIDGLPTLDPTLFEIVRHSLYYDIVSRTGSHFHWSLAPLGAVDDDRHIMIRRIVFHYPEPDDLEAVVSLYHSHNETVANPAKASLSFRSLSDLARRFF